MRSNTRASHAEDNVDLRTAYGIATQTFRNMRIFKEIITMRSRSLSEGRTTMQYLGFSNFSKSSFDEMNEIREGSDFPKFTILYDEASQILSVKIKAGVPHEACSRLFALCFESKLACNRDGDVKDWPSVVFEVGVSESLVRLRADAEIWLTSSQAIQLQGAFL